MFHFILNKEKGSANVTVFSLPWCINSDANHWHLNIKACKVGSQTMKQWKGTYYAYFQVSYLYFVPLLGLWMFKCFNVQKQHVQNQFEWRQFMAAHWLSFVVYLESNRQSFNVCWQYHNVAPKAAHSVFHLWWCTYVSLRRALPTNTLLIGIIRWLIGLNYASIQLVTHSDLMMQLMALDNLCIYCVSRLFNLSVACLKAWVKLLPLNYLL